jgi:hypothetical protein
MHDTASDHSEQEMYADTSANRSFTVRFIQTHLY